MVASRFADAFEFLMARKISFAEVRSWDDWLAYRKRAGSDQFVYLYRFDAEVFAWGTATGAGRRLRGGSMFHTKLSTKYDRRVDYLMLRILCAQPDAWVFAVTPSATAVEGELKALFGQLHCYQALEGDDRLEISSSIYRRFRETPHFTSLADKTKDDFDRYMREVFLKVPALTGPRSGASFSFGDTLEPGFLRDVGYGDLEPAIEAALKVTFDVKRRPKRAVSSADVDGE